MKEKQKVKKEFNLAIFMRSFITVSIVILYIVVMIGDVAAIIFDDSTRIITRFLPVGIVGFVLTFFYIRSSAKKCKKSEEQDMKKKIFIAPLIVAIIIFVYGLYSVHSNIKSMETEISKYEFLLEDGFETEMTKAANEARLNWGITAVIYLVAAEAAVFLLKNKLNSLMQDETEKVVLSEQIQSDVQSDMEQPTEKQEEEKQEETVNNIKWDL